MFPRLLSGLAALLLVNAATASPKTIAKKPNILVMLTDDQDLRLGSTDYQPILQRELMDKGVNFVNHHTTTAVCCPSRATLLRGQLAHNTNVTHVRSPGGDYEKWTISGLDKDYMPHHLKAAGYRTEYVGKLLNGYSLFNYNITPKGWDHIDGLMDPYNAAFNTVVMSENGQNPVHYPGWHQVDVIRAKVLDRLERLTAQDDPWLLFMAPTNPHVDNVKQYTEPLSRYWDWFPNVTSPRVPNWNPEKHQEGKSYFIKDLPLMNDTMIEWSDMEYRRRIQSLQGIDEILEDTIALLGRKGELDNTYIIYTSDNGYHVGQFRQAAGKSTPYREDSNVPLIVRGPGIPRGMESTLPSTHSDLLPTMLEITGLGRDSWPEYLDGRSLLDQWEQPLAKPQDSGLGGMTEVINIEHWGFGTIEAPAAERYWETSTYKTIRLLGDRIGWLYIVWCTGQMELYNIIEDPYELKNLARPWNQTTPEIRRTVARLNTLLLHGKSCGGDTCRDPWSAIQPDGEGRVITNFDQAMSAEYDEYFASFPLFKFGMCMNYQYSPNETPFYPPESQSLGREWRDPTDNYVLTLPETWIEANAHPAGGWETRHATLEEVQKSAVNVTAEQIFGPGRSGLHDAYTMELTGPANGS